MKKIDSLFITVVPKDEKFHGYAVIAQSESGDDLFVTKGFDENDDCWDYARMVAKANGLTENSIDTDLIGEFEQTPLVEGVNPFNRLQTWDDLMHAIMDVCIEIEKGNLTHEDATFLRISKIIETYFNKKGIEV